MTNQHESQLDKLARTLLKRAKANLDDHEEVIKLCNAIALSMHLNFLLVGDLPTAVPIGRKANPDDPDVADFIARTQKLLGEVCDHALAVIIADTNPAAKRQLIAFLFGLWLYKCSLRSKVIRFGKQAFLNVNKYLEKYQELF